MRELIDSRLMRQLGVVVSVLLMLPLASCDRTSTAGPPLQANPDDELRAALGGSGAMPIGPVAAQGGALAELGRLLFFDKLLSGNRDVSCSSCHRPEAGLGDGRTLAIGTGGRLLPRHAPSLLNSSLGLFYMFWDGSVSGGREHFHTTFNAPMPSGLANLVAAQAMLPVVNRAEMRGRRGDTDRFGNANELAALADDDFLGVWQATMKRLLAVQEYTAKFSAAYPATPVSALGFQHAANAIAAFQAQAFTKFASRFDRYLARDNGALTQEEKAGALLFFGRASCSTCHHGPLLGGQGFANAGVPQLGPGVGRGAPLDRGRGEQFADAEFYQFAFRIPPLRNVELTAPYMHSGVYRTLESVVRHYNNVDSALHAFDVAEVDPDLRGTHHGDPATVAAIKSTLDFRLRQPLRLTETEQRQIVAFLKSLTDPAARNLGALTPARVPSGLPVD